MWYRIELNKDRSVRTCVEVSGSINEGRSVHYIEADSKESAILILTSRYEIRMATGRISSLKTHHARKALGLCVSCPKPAGGPGGTATMCADHAARGRIRRAEVKAGRKLRARHDTPEARAAAQLLVQEKEKERRGGTPELRKIRVEKAAGYTHRRHLREALEAFDRDPTSFRGWLVAKIQECQDKIDGKKSTSDHFPQAAE
jgi:hypothetical protein